jgi:Uma2 family endonuclease
MARANDIETPRSMADLFEELGDIDPRRVALTPPPGKATEKDLIWLNEHTNRLYELVDGVLVEKIVGLTESILANWLSYLLQCFLNDHDLGFLAGESGGLRLLPGLVRLPDLSFISWTKVPVRGEVPDQPIARFAPDLAVEVLSKGNTPKEMKRKLKEYFLSGTRMVWFVDRKQRTVQVFTAPDRSRILTEDQVLDGGEVLPGLSLALRQIFVRMPRQPAANPRPQRPSKKDGKKRPKKSGPR